MALSRTCPSCLSNDCTSIDQVSTRAVMAGYLKSGLKLDVSRHFEESEEFIHLIRCNACDLRWYFPMVAGDGQFYVELQRNEWYYQEEKSEYGFASGHVLPQNSVLEVGCGRGAFRAHLPDDVVYRGLEFNTAALKSARDAGLDVEFRSIEEEATSSPQSYDVVCNFQVLEHVTDPHGFLDACVRCLKPGGKLIIAVPAEDSFVGIAESAWLNMPPHHLTRWSDKALTRSLAALGLEQVELWHEPLAPLHHRWQSNVVAAAGLRSLIGMRPQLVSGNWFGSTISRLNRVTSLSAMLARRGNSAHPEAGNGHTVCVVGTLGSVTT